jgi:ubiquinone/menaquinone biosynthesis C-methylase UbiE
MKINGSIKVNNSLKQFYENLADKPDIEHYVKPTGIYRKKIVIKMLSPEKNDLICDLGCGDGTLSVTFIRKVKSIVGVDFSKKRLKRAKEKGLTTVNADVQSTPFKDKSFDKIICSEVIEHVLNPEDLIREISRLLKNEGVAVVSIPLDEKIKKTILDLPMEDIEKLDFDIIKNKHLIEHCHINSFSEKQIKTVFEKNGFEIIKVDYTHNYSPRFKNKKVYSWIYWVSLKFKVNNYRIPELFFNKFVLLFYKKENSIRHIIICVKKIKREEVD